MNIIENKIPYFTLIIAICFIIVNLVSCNKSESKNSGDTSGTTITAVSETIDTDYITEAQENQAPPAITEAEPQETENADNIKFYCDDLKWYANDEIAALGFAEMYISASAKRTDPIYSQLRDPEIRLIHIIGDNGAKQINTAIDKTITEPYDDYISQIVNANYISDNLFVCQSFIIVYGNIAVIEIDYFTTDIKIATEVTSEKLMFLYDYEADKILSVPEIIKKAGTDEKTFLNVLRKYSAQFFTETNDCSLQYIKWLLPTQTGITVSLYIDDSFNNTENFTIPYSVLSCD